MNGKEELTINTQLIPVENKAHLRDFYKLGKVLGSGAFGEVRIATLLQTKEQRAIKVILKDSLESEYVF